MNPAKLHASLATAISALSSEEDVMPVILRVRRGPIARGEMQVLATLRPERTFRLLDAQVVTASQSQIAALSEDPAVDLIWPDLPVHAWLDITAPAIHAPRVWESGFDGHGVKVAILDTGIDYEHPDFADRLLAYRDFVDPEGAHASDPHDPNGHGTHVAGIAAGSGAASDGRYRGVAPGAGLVIARALDSSGSGRTSQVMAAVEWAVEMGAQVVNISLGGGPYPADGTDALSALCNAAVAEGVVVCVAAGNLGPARQTIGAPAAAAHVVSVGAAHLGDPLSLTSVCDFSSRGPTGDGRTKPDLAFPGQGVVAPRAAGTALGQLVGERYVRLNGTSQATPMATASAALLLQANPRLAPADIKARLMRGARPLAHAGSNEQGAGLGDAYNTFISVPGLPLESGEAPLPGEPTPPPTPPDLPTPRGCRPALTLAGRRS